MASNENLPPKVLNALAKELKALEESPLEDIQIIFNDDNFSIIHADIDGPFGTPYEGGIFQVKLTIGQGFPEAPPKGYFVTRIFHPNIAKNGEICVNTLKKDWAPTLGLRHVLLAIRCLLIEPFPESALNEEAGKLLMEDYEAYAKHAKLMTSIHAMKHKSRAKSEMSESTAVNAWLARSELCARASLGKNSSSRDTALDGESDASGGKSPNSSFSPCAKKLKGETGSTPSVEKKKGDLRKRGLRRL